MGKVGMFRTTVSQFEMREIFCLIWRTGSIHGHLICDVVILCFLINFSAQYVLNVPQKTRDWLDISCGPGRIVSGLHTYTNRNLLNLVHV